MNIPTDPEALRYDRDLTRAELGRTIEALSHKLDVPARTRDRLRRGTHAAQDNADRATQVAKQVPLPAVGLVLVAVVAMIWVLRKRSS